MRLSIVNNIKQSAEKRKNYSANEFGGLLEGRRALSVVSCNPSPS